MPSPWVWQEKLHRYRNTATGRFLGAKDMLPLRDKFVAVQKARMVAVTGQFTDGKFGLGRWQRDMREAIRTSFIDQYVLARGGRNMMTPADWGKIGQMVKGQNTFLRGFAADLYAGDLSAAQAQVRAAMYAGASKAAYEKGNAENLGTPDLPAYPGDGSTVCKSNCACSWEIVSTETGWDCTWSLGAAEHCPDCVDNAANWNPLHVDKP
jgi:hypothetical protein